MMIHISARFMEEFIRRVNAGEIDAKILYVNYENRLMSEKIVGMKADTAIFDECVAEQVFGKDKLKAEELAKAIQPNTKPQVKPKLNKPYFRQKERW